MRKHSRYSRTSASRDFPGRRGKAVTEFAGTDKGNVALRRDRALIVRVAGKRKSRIRQRENEAAVGDAVPVHHARENRHAQDGFAGPDLHDLHSEAFAGVVFPPHRVRARARQILTRKRSLDVHWASIASRLLSTIPPDAERRLSEHKFAGIAAASETFLPFVACPATTFFFAAARRGLTYATEVIAARKFIPILLCEPREGPAESREEPCRTLATLS